MGKIVDLLIKTVCPMPTTLAAGDLAIIGSNADDPDAFNFVLLADIDTGTEIFFTDNGVLSDGSFRGDTEGIVKYTAPTAITAGTVIQFTDISGDFTNEDTGFLLATAGDQVIAYQGSVASPTFIYAVQTNSTQFQTDSTSSNTSALPPGLTVGTTAVAVGAGPGPTDEFDNATYNETLTNGTQAELLAAIGNAANWNGSNARITNLADGPFTVVPADTTAPTVALNSDAANPILSAFSVTATFSEPTSNFTDSDITVTNGIISNFSGSGTTYTFDVAPTANGAVNVNISDNVATDAAGNGNTASNTLSRTFSDVTTGEGKLTPILANNLLEITSLGAANTVTLDVGQFGLESVSQIRIFSTDASGTIPTEIGRISLLEGEKLPNAYAPEFTVNSAVIAQGDFLQFELIENDRTRIATLTSISDGQVSLDFGVGDPLTVSLSNQTRTTNLLVDDASAIDLTGLDRQTVNVEFDVYREAEFDNTLRFYRTDFADGGIISDSLTGAVIRPGEMGYEQAAIAQQLDIEITGQNNQVNTFSTTLDGGGYLGMYLIVDGTDPETNEVYFSHAGANSNNTDRAKILGNNTFGFEDLPNLGDRDFDDIVVEFSIT